MKLQTPFFLFVGLAGGLAAAAGCHHAPEAAREDWLAIEDVPQISALENLHRRVRVSQIHEDPGPPMKVIVALRNDSDDERHIQYRIFFLDKDGVPENINPDWRYERLNARTPVYVRGNALDTKAASWRMEIRPNRRG